MEMQFRVKSSEKLEHGGANTNLVVALSEDVDGRSYWIKTNKVLPVGKVITLNTDLLVVTTETSNAGYEIQVLRAKGI